MGLVLFFGLFQGAGTWANSEKSKRCANTLFVVWRENGRELVARSENRAVKVKQKGWQSFKTHHLFFAVNVFTINITFCDELMHVCGCKFAC